MKLMSYPSKLGFPTAAPGPMQPIGLRSIVARIKRHLATAIPVFLGIVLAEAVLSSLHGFPVAQHGNNLAALAGASAWLCFGRSLRARSGPQVLLNLGTGAILVTLALAARSTPGHFLGMAFAIQAIWSFLTLVRGKQTEQSQVKVLAAWVAFNLVLAAETWTLFQ